MPAGLHVTVIFFCGVVILLSSAATGFFFFNAFGRPYEMLQGPVGLYLWTSISGEMGANQGAIVCCGPPNVSIKGPSGPMETGR